LDLESGSGLALIKGTKKLIVGKYPYLKEVFDVDRDGHETRNLFAAADEASLVQQLLSELVTVYNGYSSRAVTAEHAQLSESTARKLMALGYLAPAETSRRIPAKISVADRSPHGLTGWENLEESGGCIQTAETRYESQLLSGWYYAELGGRWTLPSASLLLQAPKSQSRPLQLSIAGESFRPDVARIRVSANERLVMDRVIKPGGFRIESEVLPVATSGTLLVSLVIEPSFQPAKGGSPDHRELGMFFRSICVAPDTPQTPVAFTRGSENSPFETTGSRLP
jgi:hypothetical protein